MQATGSARHGPQPQEDVGFVPERWFDTPGDEFPAIAEWFPRNQFKVRPDVLPDGQIRGKEDADFSVFSAETDRVAQPKRNRSAKGLWLQGAPWKKRRQGEIVAQHVIDKITLAISIRV